MGALPLSANAMGALPPAAPLAVACFLVCSFSGESLVCVGDDGTVGIIFLVEDITVGTSI